MNSSSVDPNSSITFSESVSNSVIKTYLTWARNLPSVWQQYPCWITWRGWPQQPCQQWNQFYSHYVTKRPISQCHDSSWQSTYWGTWAPQFPCAWSNTPQCFHWCRSPWKPQQALHQPFPTTPALLAWVIRRSWKILHQQTTLTLRHLHPVTSRLRWFRSYSTKLSTASQSSSIHCKKDKRPDKTLLSQI